MNNLPAGYAFTMLITISAIHFGRKGLPTDWREYIGLAAAALLFWWCFKPLRSDAFVDTHSHEQPDKGVAFRLGKLFKRTLLRSPRRR